MRAASAAPQLRGAWPTARGVRLGSCLAADTPLCGPLLQEEEEEAPKSRKRAPVTYEDDGAQTRLPGSFWACACGVGRALRRVRRRGRGGAGGR